MDDHTRKPKSVRWVESLGPEERAQPANPAIDAHVAARAAPRFTRYRYYQPSDAQQPVQGQQNP